MINNLLMSHLKIPWGQNLSSAFSLAVIYLGLFGSYSALCDCQTSEFMIFPYLLWQSHDRIVLGFFLSPLTTVMGNFYYDQKVKYYFFLYTVNSFTFRYILIILLALQSI